ncbi:MAG: Re/Si-specific NAD(P)(+) transhydrogenase subunit alpha [Robiginitomaculum sp.]|nr:Re/Si-specific NAD(P)(+) transhydrogenase subunit alpha [Robiginitomaculum sp.]
MKLAVLKEKTPEARVALLPEVVKKLVAAGHQITVEAGAGLGASVSDTSFREAGAKVAKTAKATLTGADVLLAVRRPAKTVLNHMRKGAGLIALLDPFDDPAFVSACAAKGVDAFAMEFVPRITRAQSMDALSSQSNLAGYRAVIEAAALFGKAFPMMMTAAGTIAPAKVFVMGAGVAGLQAIATARRLGAIVSATDVRPAAKEQVGSLGGKFIAVEDDEFKAAETKGGYAKQMSAAYQKAQAELVATHIAKQDIVITTALIPGRAAPKLVSEAMVKTMPEGGVIIDMAAERGGNCALTKPGAVIVRHGVTIAGYTNLPSRLAVDSSALYGRNLAALLPLLTAENGSYGPNWEDEIVQGANLTKGGKITNDAFIKKPAVKKVVAKKAGPKKAVMKKPVAKKATAKKPVVKKPATKKATAKKPVTKSTAAQRPATKSTVAKRPAAKKTVAKRPVSKKKGA